MNLSFHIAKRYLVAKKKQNAINIISLISVIGMAVGTMALVVILSVFNGFDDLIQKLLNSFDPDIRITATKGKFYNPNGDVIPALNQVDFVEAYSQIAEENALLKYGDRQFLATIKGVDSNFVLVSGVDSMMYDGNFSLYVKNSPHAVVGLGVAHNLGIGLNFITPIHIYMPKRTGRASLNPERAFNRKYIFPSGIFSIQNEFDGKYILIPIKFARELLEFTNEVTAIEVKLAQSTNHSYAKEELQAVLGDEYQVKTRYELNEVVFKMMKSEKWAIFFILTFVLIIASFNIIGSLTMLIIEKKKDIEILKSMGANQKLIQNIFLTEGWLISIVGSLTGVMLGVLICFVQQNYGLVKLGGGGSFIIDAYPVKLVFSDIIYSFITVVGIGYLSAWFPVRYISNRLQIQ